MKATVMYDVFIRMACNGVLCSMKASLGRPIGVRQTADGAEPSAYLSLVDLSARYVRGGCSSLAANDIFSLAFEH